MSKTYRLLIVEDEADAIELITSMIKEFVPELEIVAVAQNVEEALKAITAHSPSVLMLDVNLGNETCFDILEKIDSSKYHIIFTTAYEQYAFDAFQYDAVHYLLKPYSISGLRKTIEKLNDVAHAKTIKEDLQKFIKLTIDGTSETLKLADISHLLAVRGYVKIYRTTQKPILYAKTLIELTAEMQSDNFIRVHNSYIINREHLSEYKRENGQDFLIMKNNDRIPIARRRKSEVFQLLGIS